MMSTSTATATSDRGQRQHNWTTTTTNWTNDYSGVSPPRLLGLPARLAALRRCLGQPGCTPGAGPPPPLPHGAN